MKTGFFIHEDISGLPGIQNKVNLQIESLKYDNERIIELSADKRTFTKKILTRIPVLGNDWKQASNKIQIEKDVNYVYVRKPFYLTYSFMRLLKKIRQNNKNAKIVMEFPTYPYDKERNSKLINLSLKKEDNFWRKRLELVDRIVTYSNDEYIFNRPTIKINNGVIFNEDEKKKRDFHNDRIYLIGVASINFWHGYDRIIEGLGEYYKDSNNKFKVYFIIVGDGNSTIILNYRELIFKYNLENYIILTGEKRGESLNEIYNFADIGVDSLARHRSGIYFNSSLKAKEYLARGLPIISGVESELDSYDIPFYKRFSSNDEPIDIKEIISFYLGLSFDQLSDKIFDFGKEHFDIDVVLNPVKYFLNS